MTTQKTPSNLALYVAFRAQQEQEQKGSSWSEIAKRYGCSKPNLYNVWKLKTGVGKAFERELAARWAGGKRDELDRAVNEWRAAYPAWMPSWYKVESARTVPGWDEAAAAARRKEPDMAKWIKIAGDAPLQPDLRPARATVRFVLVLAGLHRNAQNAADVEREIAPLLSRPSSTMPKG